MVEPIKPGEMAQAKANTVPDLVKQVWNKLITKNWNGYSARITQKEAVETLMSSLGVTRADITNGGYLNIEDLYRGAGWRVVYDKPGYCEDYDAFFEFIKKGA